MPACEVVDGRYRLSVAWSAIERVILRACEDHLDAHGLTYLAVPSMVSQATYARQGVTEDGSPVLGQAVEGAPGSRLGGSAEQGILERFADAEAQPARYWARNACFRSERTYEGLLRLREFTKIEQFAFAGAATAQAEFEALLGIAYSFTRGLGVSARVVDRTDDPGYHVEKRDIEVLTEAYGWLETHSITRFGTEQSARFGITGADHTVSATGIATPRILVPLMEAAGVDVTTAAASG